MPLKHVFTDGDHNEMDLYINHAGKLFIQVGEPVEDQIQYAGHITLDKDDIIKLIEVLSVYSKEME